MNRLSRRDHSIDSVFSVILFGLFVLFLLLLLISSARIYKMSISGLHENQNLHTAVSYITTKFRQHDSPDQVSLITIDEIPVLCFSDTIDQTEYHTYIYLKDNHLLELFTASESQATLEMGTPLAELQSFSMKMPIRNYYKFSITDLEGHTSQFLLHAGSV